VLSIYGAFIRNAFLNMLAYRLRYFTGILTYLLFVSVHYFIWSAVYSGHGEGTLIKGFTLPEMLSYVALGWVSRSLYHSNIDNEVNELVRSGQISVFLLRPVPFHAIMLVTALGESLFRLLFFTLPISVVIFLVFPVLAPSSVYAGLSFLIAICFSFFVLAEINFIVGLLAFFIKSIDGIMRAKYYLIQLFSGLLLPLTFFPQWFSGFLDWLPFKLIAYVPLQIYLGKIESEDIAAVFLEASIWSLLLLLLSQLLWVKAMKKLTLQGG